MHQSFIEKSDKYLFNKCNFLYNTKFQLLKGKKVSSYINKLIESKFTSTIFLCHNVNILK